MKFRLMLAAGLAAGALAVPGTTAAAHAAPAVNTNYFFDGAVHPFGNPHWCFFGALSSKIAIVTGTPVVLEKCRSTSKHLPVGGEYWHGYRVGAKNVGQMFLLAKANYVLGRHNRKTPVVFVPFEYTSDTDGIIAFNQDKHGHWYIDLVDQKNKKPYVLIMPEHLKTSATYYPLRWRELDLGIPKGYTDIVILPKWEQVHTV